MAKSYPVLGPLRDLKYALGQMRLNDLAVGHDGRNRTLLSPFWTRTSRNMPSNANFIFGPAVWLRGLIKPPPGHAIDYVDWSGQEFGIAAVLSNDPNMLKAYLSSDPYFYFAQLAGAIPADTPCTRESRRYYAAVREQYKGVCLGVQYGQTEYGIALKLGITIVAARALLAAHRAIFPVFWRWIDDTVGRAMLTNQIHATFGWTAHLTAGSNPRALMNWPMQTNGSEMMRLAAA
jgi:DNA polymerase I-like protein with 3'-5' exonuclease and polymerase domains